LQRPEFFARYLPECNFIKLDIVFYGRIVYNMKVEFIKSKAEMRAIGYAGGRALYGGAPRTMSGGEPSSIKRIDPCDAVCLSVCIS